jgi:hypothetical protein
LRVDTLLCRLASSQFRNPVIAAVSMRSRVFWGLRLHLVTTVHGLPVAFALALGYEPGRCAGRQNRI